MDLFGNRNGRYKVCGKLKKTTTKIDLRNFGESLQNDFTEIQKNMKVALINQRNEL